jgi:hypothetical protein
MELILKRGNPGIISCDSGKSGVFPYSIGDLREKIKGIKK